MNGTDTLYILCISNITLLPLLIGSFFDISCFATNRITINNMQFCSVLVFEDHFLSSLHFQLSSIGKESLKHGQILTRLSTMAGKNCILVTDRGHGATILSERFFGLPLHVNTIDLME